MKSRRGRRRREERKQTLGKDKKEDSENWRGSQVSGREDCKNVDILRGDTGNALTSLNHRLPGRT